MGQRPVGQHADVVCLRIGQQVGLDVAAEQVIGRLDGFDQRPAAGLSGERISVAERGRARRAATASRVACRSSGSPANVRPGARDWISTLSAGGKVTFSRFRVCSARPDWPESYDGTFVAETTCPPAKTAATRSSHPITAVLRCVALHPAMRSTTGPRGRRAGLFGGFWPY